MTASKGQSFLATSIGIIAAKFGVTGRCSQHARDQLLKLFRIVIWVTDDFTIRARCNEFYVVGSLPWLETNLGLDLVRRKSTEDSSNEAMNRAEGITQCVFHVV